MRHYPNLSSPITIRGVTFKNRIVATPTGLTYPDEYSQAPDFRTVMYYEEKARGGAAEIIYGETPVNDVDAARRPNVDLIRDDFERMILRRKDWIKYTDAIRRHDAIASIQLAHAGLFAEPIFNKHRGVPLGPVSFTKENGTFVKGMDADDMDRIANDFAEAALSAKQAGFQVAMIQCCHGWLLAQFLSPAWNTRTDEFGGPIENRAKFPLMVLAAVRERVGSDMLIEIRISGDEHQVNGWSVDDAVAFAKMTEGLVDIIQVSAGDYHNSEEYCFPDSLMPHFMNVPFAEALKQAGVGIPIAVVGANNDPLQMEQLIERGSVDFIAIGRGLLADNQLPEKVLQGREDEVRPCIRCGECMARINDGFYGCSVNPAAGQEAYLLWLQNSPAPRKVLVIGGGPAGMQAALTARDRGHDVTLVEKGTELGGTLLFADADPHKQDLRQLKDYLVRQVKKGGICVRLGETADTALVKSLAPDAVIVATGASPKELGIPGSEKSLYAAAAYSQPEKMGRKVAIIGGGLVGVEVAHFLLEQGKEVVILERCDTIAREGNKLHRPVLLEKLYSYGDRLSCLLNVSVAEITDEGVFYSDGSGVMNFAEAETVLYAIGNVSNAAFENELGECGSMKTYRKIGDCNGVGIVGKAIREGFEAAISIR